MSASAFAGWTGPDDDAVEVEVERRKAERRVVAKRALRRIAADPRPVVLALSRAGLVQEASAIMDLAEVFRTGGIS